MSYRLPGFTVICLVSAAFLTGNLTTLMAARSPWFQQPGLEEALIAEPRLSLEVGKIDREKAQRLVNECFHQRCLSDPALIEEAQVALFYMRQGVRGYVEAYTDIDIDERMDLQDFYANIDGAYHALSRNLKRKKDRAVPVQQ